MEETYGWTTDDERVGGAEVAAPEPAPTADSDVVVHRPAALQHFEDALEVIDDGEKAPYLEARMRCPQSIFDYECPPELFLRACRWDPWQAARRIVEYWKERVHVFGPERAYLPLIAVSTAPLVGDNMAENGNESSSSAATSADPSAKPSLTMSKSALTETEVEILETGSIQLLPPDSDGRSVLFFDRSRLQSHHHHMTMPRLRVVWYMLQKAVLAGSTVGRRRSTPGTKTGDGGLEEDQQHSIVVLALLVRPPGSGYDLQFPRWCVRLPSCLPIAVHSIHLLTLPSESGSGRLLQMVVSTAMNMLGGYFGKKAMLHHGSSSSATRTHASSKSKSSAAYSSLLNELKNFGLSKRGLPAPVGSFDGFGLWLSKLRRKEQALYATEEQLQERKRRINKLHSVKKRQRRKREFEELRETAEKLQADNATANAERRKLEQLLDQAHQVLIQIGKDSGQGYSYLPDPIYSAAAFNDSTGVHEDLHGGCLDDHLGQHITDSGDPWYGASNGGFSGSCSKDTTTGGPIPTNSISFDGTTAAIHDQNEFVAFSAGTATSLHESGAVDLEPYPLHRSFSEKIDVDNSEPVEISTNTASATTCSCADGRTELEPFSGTDDTLWKDALQEADDREGPLEAALVGHTPEGQGPDLLGPDCQPLPVRASGASSCEGTIRLSTDSARPSTWNAGPSGFHSQTSVHPYPRDINQRHYYAPQSHRNEGLNCPPGTRQQHHTYY